MAEKILIFSPLAILALWLYAECKWRLYIRIALGLTVILSFCLITHSVDQIMPRYESDLHRGSLSLIEDLLARGDVVAAQAALTTYNREAQRGSAYNAALAMWTQLHKEKSLEVGAGTNGSGLKPASTAPAPP